MRKKIISIFIIVLSILFLSTWINPVLADNNGLEIKYPRIENFKLNASSTFPQYVKYIYRFGIWIAGIIAVFILISGGIAYMTSSGNPARMNGAKSQIIASLVGLGIIFTSWFIINMINPQLHTLKIENINNIGIWLEDKNGNRFAVSDDVFSLPKNFIPQKICFASNDKNGKEPLYKSRIKGLYTFFLPNFQGPTAQKFDSSSEGCQNISGSNIKSIKILWKTPGIYVYINNSVGVPLPFAIKSDNYDIRVLVKNLYDNNWQSIEIKNSSTTDLGAIFYSQPFYAGRGYIYPGKTENGQNVGINPVHFKFESVYLFDRDPGGSVNAYLYKTLHYKEKDENGATSTCPGFYPIQTITDKPKRLGKICSQKVQSIKVYRGLVILIQTKNPGRTPPYGFIKAEPLTSNDPDLTDNYIGQCGSRSLLHWFRYVPKPCATHLMILPIKR